MLDTKVSLLELVNTTSELASTLSTGTQSNMWISNLSNLFEGETLTEGQTYNYDISDLIPTDGEDYELIMIMSCNKGNAILKSGDYTFVGGNYSSSADREQVLVPVSGSTRTLQVYAYSICENFWLQLVAYRKIPSNIIVQQTVDQNFIPKGTIITVGNNKDFTTLQSAIAYLQGKYSNGGIIISIDEGTYSVSDIDLIDEYCNIPKLLIKGNNTILNFTSTEGVCFGVANMTVQFEDLTINRPNINTSVTGEDTLRSYQRGLIHIRNCTFNNHSSALSAYLEGTTYLSGTNTFNNCNMSIWAGACGNCTTAWGAVINISNSKYGFYVSRGGIICGNGSLTINCTNVANRRNQNNATLTSDGFITGC